MIIDDLPDAPDPVIDPPKTFSMKAAGMVLALKNMVPQLRAAIASVGIIAGGSANKIPYKIDLNSQVVGDPGSGWLRLNNATQSSATALLLDLIGNDLVDYTGLIGTFSASSSAVLGQVRIEKQADASKFLAFNVTAVTLPTGYRQLTVTNTQASSANPFAHGDIVVLSYSRTGDKGDQGPIQNFPTLYVRDERASGTVGSTPTAVTICQINTVKVNTITGATLSNFNVSLPAGTYEFVGTVPAANVNNFQAQLWNNTDGTSITTGTSEYSAAATSNASARSVVRGSFTLAATKNVVLRALVPNGASGYLGVAANTGNVETYAELWIKKVA